MLHEEHAADEDTRSGFFVNTVDHTGVKQYVLVRPCRHTQRTPCMPTSWEALHDPARGRKITASEPMQGKRVTALHPRMQALERNARGGRMQHYGGRKADGFYRIIRPGSGVHRSDMNAEGAAASLGGACRAVLPEPVRLMHACRAAVA